MPIDSAGATHAGRVRTKNEDTYRVAGDIGLAMIADGMGGHAAGDVAAHMALEEVERCMRDENAQWIRKATEDRPGPLVTVGLLAHAVQQANKAICFTSRHVASCSGMGTTFAAVLVAHGYALLAHVGDSRIYRLRQGDLTQLAEDHSLAAEYLRIRGIRADPRIAKQQAHILTRCLGTRPEVRVATNVERLTRGDVYLLCTDGLWGVLDNHIMARIIDRASDPQQAVDQLIEAANENGAPDNITAVLVRPFGTSGSE